VVAFGAARKLEETDKKTHALSSISEHLLQGRWKDVRPPTERELKATTVLECTIEAWAKIRQGPPLDDEDDYSLPVWAGFIPMKLEAQAPEPDSRLAHGITLPPYALCRRGK
jgi:hypothetical protein